MREHPYFFRETPDYSRLTLMHKDGIHPRRSLLKMHGHTREYAHVECDAQGRLQRFVLLHEYRGAIRLALYVNLRYNERGHIEMYEDYRGNIWHKHWQVPMPYQKTLDEFHESIYWELYRIKTYHKLPPTPTKSGENKNTTTSCINS